VRGSRLQLTRNVFAGNVGYSAGRVASYADAVVLVNSGATLNSNRFTVSAPPLLAGVSLYVVGKPTDDATISVDGNQTVSVVVADGAAVSVKESPTLDLWIRLVLRLRTVRSAMQLFIEGGLCVQEWHCVSGCHWWKSARAHGSSIDGVASGRMSVPCGLTAVCGAGDATRARGAAAQHDGLCAAAGRWHERRAWSDAVAGPV
jgi:hypothetical protein